MSSTRPSVVRLLKVHHAIAGGQYPSVARLAAVCEVDARTVKRDLRTLREEFGAPAQYVKARGGYAYDGSFTLEKLALTEGEELALCMMLTLAGAMRNTHLAARMERLLAKLQVVLPGPAHTALAPESPLVSCLSEPAPCSSVESAIHFNDVLRAIEAHRQIRMRYFSMERQVEGTRVVDPYHLYFYRGMWYLHGWCHTRREPRDFAVERMRAVEVLTTTFPPPDLAAMRQRLEERFANIDDEVTTVVIQFDAAWAPRIHERVWHPTQEITPCPDGGCVLTMRVSGLASLRAWILGFGRHATPLAPPALVRLVEDEIAAMAGRIAASPALSG